MPLRHKLNLLVGMALVRESATRVSVEMYSKVNERKNTPLGVDRGSSRCTLTYAPFGSPTSSHQGSPHYRLRPSATLRSLTGLPLYWDASSQERRTAQWRARPAERHADGRLRSQPSQARKRAAGLPTT